MCEALAGVVMHQGHKGDGLDGDEDGDTEDGTDNGTGRHTRRAKRQAASDDTDMQAAMSGMAQLGPAEMMQLQAAGLMLPQQFWAGALAGMEGHDMDVSQHANTADPCCQLPTFGI